MKVQYGISISPFLDEEKDIQEVIEAVLVEDIGFRHIEIPSGFVDEYVDFFLQMIENFGVSYTIHAPYMDDNLTGMNLCSNKKRQIRSCEEWIERTIQLAKDLKAGKITIHPDKPTGSSKKAALKIFKQHVNYALERMDSNMMLLIENMQSKSYAISTPAEMADILSEIKSRQVACTWDVSHSRRAVDGRFLDFPKVLKKRIRHVHMHDIRGRTYHLPLGRGKLDLRQVGNSLKDIKYSGIVNLEIKTTNPLEVISSKNLLENMMK